MIVKCQYASKKRIPGLSNPKEAGLKNLEGDKTIKVAV